MAIVLFPDHRITDANGNPISGGKLYVFEAGTSNPRDVYEDDALTTPHAHPVVADSGGLLPVIYSAQDDLKLRTTDASDVTIFEADEYTAGTAAGSSGSASRPIVALTANRTVQASENGYIFAMDASGIPGLQGDVTADSATLGSGFIFGVKNVGSSGTVLVQGTGAQTIDDAANRSLTSQYEFIDLASRGAAGWFVLASQGEAQTSLTIRQPDASTDGNLNYEDELGVVRWQIVHKTSTDELHIERHNSSGVYQDTPVKINASTGALTVTTAATFESTVTVDGNFSAAPRTVLVSSFTSTSGTTATSSTIDFATLNDAGYRDLIIQYDNVSVSSQGNLTFEVSDDDGSNWGTANFRSANVRRDDGSSSIIMVDSIGYIHGLESATSFRADGFIIIHNFASTTSNFPKIYQLGGRTDNNDEPHIAAGRINNIAEIDKIRFVTNTGFDEGSISIFART